MSRTGVLFVCLGNICRSPLAEGVFLHQAAEAGLSEAFLVESAGTSGYHVGDRPDPRSIAVAKKHGVELPSRSRKVADEDFTRFAWIVAMDAQNQRDLEAQAASTRDPSARLVCMRDYDPQGPGDVPDPYYGGPGGFDRVYAQVERSCAGLLEALRAQPD